MLKRAGGKGVSLLKVGDGAMVGWASRVLGLTLRELHEVMGMTRRPRSQGWRMMLLSLLARC